MTRAEHSTKLTGDSPRDVGGAPQQPQTGKKPEDARGDPQQQAENQRDLGVDESHKTDKMKEEHRGTFP
jgi:hypothetical protein